jgi:hypothetical protein
MRVPCMVVSSVVVYVIQFASVAFLVRGHIE